MDYREYGAYSTARDNGIGDNAGVDADTFIRGAGSEAEGDGSLVTAGISGVALSRARDDCLSDDTFTGLYVVLCLIPGVKPLNMNE